jgi:ribosomal protein S5
VIARALRREGDRRARELAEAIEQACRAAVKTQIEVLRA